MNRRSGSRPGRRPSPAVPCSGRRATPRRPSRAAPSRSRFRRGIRAATTRRSSSERRTLPWKIVDGVRCFTSCPARSSTSSCRDSRRSAGATTATSTSVIEAVEGERVRVYVTNRLPEATTVHLHGCCCQRMDGVAGLTQKSIAPGETSRRSRCGRRAVHVPPAPRRDDPDGARPDRHVRHHTASPGGAADRDFVLLLTSGRLIQVRRAPIDGDDGVHMLTMNGASSPRRSRSSPHGSARADSHRQPLSMDHHPIHLHGYVQDHRDRRWSDRAVGAVAETTVLVPTGSSARSSSSPTRRETGSCTVT